MKKLILLAFCFVVFASSSFASTLIHKSTLARKGKWDITTTREIPIDAKYQQLRVIIVRQPDPTEKAVEKNPFTVDVSSFIDGVLFKVVSNTEAFDSCTFLIDTPPPTIMVNVGDLAGNFTVIVLGS